MFEFEEVKETTARVFAKEVGAAFKLVSAKSSNGIEVSLCLMYRTCFTQQGRC
jgi:hypothetical protein